MIAATRRWFRRNRNTIVVGSCVIGAGYLTGQYALSKIQEARQRMSEERIAKENLRRRFEQNQEDCTYTVLALLPTVREEIIGALPVEQLTEQLQAERQERLKRLGGSEAASSELPSGPPSVADDASLQSSSFIHASQIAHSNLNIAASSSSSSKPERKRSKAQLWQEMKINSIARAVTLLYTVSLLTMLTRIQLNLLGRRTYLSSVVALASPPPPREPGDERIEMENRDDDNFDNMYGNDFETNRKYLTFSWWLLHRGSKEILERVLVVVKEVFGAVNIREDVSLERLADLTMQVRTKIEGATEEERRSMKWLHYLLPPREDEAFVIRQSMSESGEESSSPEALHVEDPMAASSVEAGESAEAVNDSLRRLLDETSDLIDSPTFTYVLTRLLDASFSHLIDFHIATEAFGVTGPTAPGTLDEPRVTDVTDGEAETEKKCKIAHILPIFCKQAHVIAAGSGELDAIAGAAAQQSLGNEYLAAIDRVHDLNAFAAVIYSSNFEYEVAESASTTAPRRDSPESGGETGPAIAGAVEKLEHEREPPVVGLGESGVLLGEDAPSAEASGGPSLFEAAWKKVWTGEQR